MQLLQKNCFMDILKIPTWRKRRFLLRLCTCDSNLFIYLFICLLFFIDPFSTINFFFFISSSFFIGSFSTIMCLTLGVSNYFSRWRSQLHFHIFRLDIFYNVVANQPHILTCQKKQKRIIIFMAKVGRNKSRALDQFVSVFSILLEKGVLDLILLVYKLCECWKT